jgi:hypothetical protein
MKKAILILVVFMALAGGVFLWIQNAKKSVQKNPTTSSSTTQKTGTTTKTGIISSSGGVFYLQESGQTPKEIDSYAINLVDYLGQSVTVSGQYSGDTLFVGSIEAK